jgi:serine/threonine-protein kinase
MAELFLAKDTRNGRMVVLKRILPYLAEEAEFVRMFLDEARIAASLHHPSIVELYELGHLEGSTFIAMEWVDGIDLRRVLLKEQEMQHAVPHGIAAWLVARLCEGLHHAHQARDASGAPLGIIHRDVSPQNVMVSFRADVKLVDFGIAKATAWMDRSKPGVIKGKFLYLAPEQLTTEPLDHRIDLFAIGTMLYELTTGQSPFYRTSTEAVIYAIRMEEPDPPSKVQPGFPRGLEKVILKCLVKDREKRYQSAEEITQGLEEFIRTEAPTSRDDVGDYISRIFGDANERTSIYIPPNALGGKADVPTDKNQQRQKLGEGDDEATRSISTKAERPRAKSGENPWQASEATMPMPSEAVVRATRDLQSTAEIDQSRESLLGDEDIPPTAVSVSGARDVEVGQVFKPLVPTMIGESDAALAPARALGSRPVPKLPNAKPAPPLPSYDDLPEVSAISAGDATMGSLFDDLPEKSEPSQPSEPTPPPPSTRAPPRRGPPPSIKRPSPRDPDDDVATVDQPNEFTAPTPSSSQKVLLAIFGVAALVVLALLAVLLWPSSKETPSKKPVVEAPKPAPAPGVATKVKVQIRAIKGTSLTVDGLSVTPDGFVERSPGPLVVKFVCPPKKKVKATPGTLRADIPESTGVVAVEVPCR